MRRPTAGVGAAWDRARPWDRKQPTTYATPQADTSAATNQSAPSSADRGPRKTSDDSSSQQPDAASTATSSQAFFAVGSHEPRRGNDFAGESQSWQPRLRQRIIEPGLQPAVRRRPGRRHPQGEEGRCDGGDCRYQHGCNRRGNGATIAVGNPATDAQAKAAAGRHEAWQRTVYSDRRQLAANNSATAANGQSAAAQNKRRPIHRSSRPRRKSRRRQLPQQSAILRPQPRR